MAAKVKRVKTWKVEEAELEDRERQTVYDVFFGKIREKTVLQRLIMVAKLPNGADRTELGAHYEKLNFQLSKQYIWDNITGLLLIYPSYLLNIIESSRDVLLFVLRDLREMQQQTKGALVEAAKVVFMAHDPQNRLFYQWSYKVLEAAQMQHRKVQDEESTETLVCTVLSTLQDLSKHPDIAKKALPGSVLDRAPELTVPQEVLESLVDRDELQDPQQHLQLYSSPLNVTMDFGKRNFYGMI